MLPLTTFKTVISSTPLISIDFVVKKSGGKVLLGKRTNRPAKGYWFVPGGRVLKDEPLEIAFERLLMSELALQKQCAQFLGVYQHFYTENVTEESFSTHYIVLAYEITFDGNITDLPIAQHNEYNWFTEAELLKNTEVHEHSKWYFQETKEADYNFCS